MEMTGEQLIPASQQAVWDALNDPEVLKACIPGCESIERVGENEYQVLMVARVGPVAARFKGRLALSDIQPPASYAITFEGQGGAAGFAKGGARVRLVAENPSTTRLAYEAKASVGGKLAQIGSRLVDAAARKVADDFFRNFNEKLSALHGQKDMHKKEEHHAQPLPRDPDLPNVTNTTLAFFAGGALVVCTVALVALLG
ncbi:MAG: carbon monoxide dehydrogenase subunit G [Pseudomonadota bacterium]|nr:carbon monoxide dehydrogenase subunit G [Pseudomonadota bacterium]